jgi:hypothetical protein
MGEFFAAFSDAKVTTMRGMHVGDVVVLEWVLNGTHSGDFMGMKPTGKRLGYRGVSVLWFGEKGVKREHMYFDHVTFMAQLGSAPKGMTGRPVMEVPADHKAEWVVAAGNDAEKKNTELVTSFYGAWEKKDSKVFLDLRTTTRGTRTSQPKDAEGARTCRRSSRPSARPSRHEDEDEERLGRRGLRFESERPDVGALGP